VSEKKQEPSIDALWVRAEGEAGRGDFSSLVSTLRTLVDRGVWQLCSRIGELYESGGHGLQQDMVEAVRWYRKAIFEGDDPVAHVGLGRAYYNGSGVDRDSAQAVAHFEKAHRAGRPEAALYLGMIYYREEQMGVDISRTRALFEQAAQDGFPAAGAFLAKIAWSQGAYLRGAMLTIRSWLAVIRLTLKDPDDARLLGLHSNKQQARHLRPTQK